MDRRLELLEIAGFKPSLGCPEQLAIGINAFRKEIFKGPIYSLTSRNPSVFSLMKKHLDTPVRNLFEEHDLTWMAENIVPSKLYKPPPYISLFRPPFPDPVSEYEIVRNSLSLWTDFLRSLAKQNSTKQGFDIYESLTFFIYKLKLLQPKSELVGFSSDEKSTKMITTRVGNSHRKYCVLCWRHTVRRKNSLNDRNHLGKLGSEKFCSCHVPNGEKNNMAHYHRDRRFKKYFDAVNKSLNLSKVWRERGPIDFSEKINSDMDFMPPLRWYLENLPCLDIQERRKVAYDLARSRLNTKIRKKIITLKGRGQSNSVISRELGISRQAISKNIITIENTVKTILESAFLDRTKKTPVRMTHKERAYMELRHTKDSPYIYASSEVIELEEQKLRSTEEVTLEEFYKASLENFDRPFRYRW